MNIKALFIGLLFLAVSAFSYWWLNQKKATCCTASPPVSPITETPKATIPLYFNWSSDEPKQGEGFATYKKAQVANLGPSDTLVITTWYYENETNGEAIAIQRAEKTKALFRDVAGNRIKITTEKRLASTELSNADFVAASFSIAANQNSLVKKSGDKILIYFASNSSAKMLEKEIDDYLTILAAEMKSNASIKVVATGYTDNIGNALKNITLSNNRAGFVKAALEAKGVEPSRITTNGKGNQDPIASNETDEGRRQNRRVELTITNQ